MKESEKEAYERGRRDEHLIHCGWCRQGLKCPYPYKLGPKPGGN